MVEFSALQGKTLTAIRQVGDDVIDFECDDGTEYRLYHSQDCCESVNIEDVSGDYADLLGTPVLVAEERVSENGVVPDGCSPSDDSNTWTFYTLRTIKGTVDIRWHGSSNGYYSESVDFAQTRGLQKAGGT